MINENKKIGKREKGMSVFQIALLLMSLVAFGYITGEFARNQEIEVSYGLGVVSAEEGEELSGTQICRINLDCPEGKICRDGICVRGEDDVRPQAEQEESPATATDSDPIRYKKGQWFCSSDDPENCRQLEEDDLDDKGAVKEDSAFAKWAKGIGMTVANGVVVDRVRGALPGWLTKGGAERGAKGLKGFQLFTKQGLVSFGSSAIGTVAAIFVNAAIGAAINWAIWKWAFGSDVRHMRDVTQGTLYGGAIGAGAGLIALAFGVGPVGWIALGAAFAASMLWSAATFRYYSQEVFVYLVEAWRAPTGGEYCNLCNELPYGCSEYECKSFGRACELINRGTDNELCVWHEPEDISRPHVVALKEVLPGFDPRKNESELYRYKPIEEEVITGVQIFFEKDEDDPDRGCIPPYTAVTLGIETDKYASCRIDTERGLSYDQMTAPMTSFEGYQDKHILKLPHVVTPSEESQRRAGIPDYLIRNGELVQFYIRCESFNGFANPEDYIMEFCVQDGPDLLPPEIVGTNYEEETHIMYNQTSLPIQIYTDKPTEACNWDVVDRRYEEMENNITDCTNETGDMLPGFNYGCVGEITGLRDREDNTIYIRCKSAEEGRVSEESYVLNFKGTQPLIIDDVTINGQANGSVIKDSVSDIRVRFEVETSFGADNGRAICYHDLRADGKFYNEGSRDYHRTNTHSTPLRATEDGIDYEVEIRCHDKGSNWAETVIEFTLETDRSPPIVVGSFRTERELNILTDKPSECVYSKDAQERCRYAIEDGLPMAADGRGTMHKVTWEPGDVFYIKCQDEFGNQPHQPDECSAIVRPFEER